MSAPGSRFRLEFEQVDLIVGVKFDQRGRQLGDGERVLDEREARFGRPFADLGPENSVSERAEGVDMTGRTGPDAADPSFETDKQSVTGKSSEDSPGDSGAGLWCGVISEVETAKLIACRKAESARALQNRQVSGAELVPELIELAAADTTAHEGTP